MKTIKWIIALILLAVLNYFLVLKDYFPQTKSDSVKDTTETGIEIRKSFYDSGQLKADAQIINDQRHGVAHNYYKDGAVHTKMHYENGVKSGLATWFYPNGKTYRTTPYRMGKIHGVQKKYYKNGKIKAEIPYSNGMLLKGTKEFTEEGKEINKQPNFIIKKIDESHEMGRFVIKIKLSKKVNKLTINAFSVQGESKQALNLSLGEDNYYTFVVASTIVNSADQHVLIQASYKSDRGNKTLIEKII